MLRLVDVGRSVGARRLFAGVCLEVRRDDRIGLVGPNGAGKTTLLRIAAGDETPDAGERIVPAGIRVSMLRQEIDPTRPHSVRAEVASAQGEIDALAAELRDLERQMAALGAEGREVPAGLAERYDRLHSSFELRGGFEREARVERVLAGLGFEPAARDAALSALSGGWLMRVALAKLLLASPDVLLLDEPTNHLDLPSIEWFEETLAGFPGAVVVVSHDRTFLRRHVRRVAELEAGRFTVYEGGLDAYLAEKALRREQLLAAQQAQDRRIAETERFIERFRYKASKARQVQSRIRSLTKLDRVVVDAETRRAPRLRLAPAPRAGRVVIELAGVHKAYGARRVFEGIDLVIERGERVALAGPNGAGKSTLLRILAGVLPFEAGARRAGHNVSAAYFAQHQLEALQPGNTVLEELAREASTEDVPRLRGHLGAFLFTGDEVEKKVAVLSGGEKARLALARLLLRPANLLVMDEPTNHLDLAARAALEDFLAACDGTLVFISHDRSFINALATRVVEVRAGRLRSFPGNYDDYLAKLGGPSATAAPLPGSGDRAPRETPAAARLREARQSEREARKARERAARRLDALEAEIAQHESALGALDVRLADPAIYRDGEQVRAIEADRATLRAALEAAYQEWERLGADREASD
jgi:ATP-binding cassette subfamily F protein 3